VIWAASEASTCTEGSEPHYCLEVYDDSLSDVTDAVVITPHPVESGDASIAGAAQENGVMKVQVTGLQSNTTYYFRTITTSKSTDDTTYYPAETEEPLGPVTTESMTVRTQEIGGDTVPFSNDVIIGPCYMSDGTTPAVGTLLVATFEGGSFPITAYVGDGASDHEALIDLNNAFSSETNQNLDLSEGKKLTLLNFRGMDGYSIIDHNVPEDLSLCDVKPPDPGLSAGANFISFQLEPGNTETQSVLASCIDKVSAIWAYDAVEEGWFFYDKNGPPFLNNLDDLHSFTGYWLIMEDDASCLINGAFNTNPIPLWPGANLVGYRSIAPVPLMEATGPIYDKLESIWTYDNVLGQWIFHDKNGPPFLNKLEVVEPGRAYWVVVTEYCEW
jgi:hypothetical protein